MNDKNEILKMIQRKIKNLTDNRSKLIASQEYKKGFFDGMRHIKSCIQKNIDKEINNGNKS